MHFSIDRTVHTTAFDKPVVDHWLERKIAQTAAGSTEKDRSDDRPLQRRAHYRLSYIPLPEPVSTFIRGVWLWEQFSLLLLVGKSYLTYKVVKEKITISIAKDLRITTMAFISLVEEYWLKFSKIKKHGEMEGRKCFI